MWRARIRRRLSQFTLTDYKPGLTEVGFPVDGAHKTKQLLLETVSRGNLDYLLPAFRSKGITFKQEASLNELEVELQRIKAAKDLKDKATKGLISEEKMAGSKWEEFHFPYYLGKWSASSRRVYYLPDDLILLLEATSLKGVTFRDVRLPFPSFAIALETPLVTDEGKELDFFLIGECSVKCFALYGFARSLSKVKLTNPLLRAKIDDAALKGNLRRFMQFADKEFNQFIGAHWEATVKPGITNEDMDEDLEKALSEAERISKEENWMTKLFRIFLGLSFYLSTFNHSYSNTLERIPNAKKVYAGAKDGAALFSAADVCKVQNIVQLTPQEKVILRDQVSGRGGWEVRAHFREGFWRRPRGEGHNPAALKTIWVRPTLVRRDRLPENALPLGVGNVVSL